ncbi:MAG: hypothetical protein ACT4PM_11060 [Gemmatimonadales bacterium]
MRAPILAAGAVACSATGSLLPAKQVGDSAAIRIVENSQPVLPTTRRWRLSPQPILQIGKTDGDSLYELLRVNGVTRLSDGRIAVANDGTRTIRFYDRQGVYLGGFGRDGDGPGEFRQILQFRRIRGDSLVVTDNLSRSSYFSPGGRFARVWRCPRGSLPSRPEATTWRDSGAMPTTSSMSDSIG